MTAPHTTRKTAMASDHSAIVEFRHVTKRYDDAGGPAAAQHPAALDDVSLSIRSGEIFGIIGESGAGKSTLLELINALTRPTAGEVLVRGTDVTRLEGAALRALRRDIGVVFQGVHLLAGNTVRDNVRLPLRLAKDGSTRQQQRTAVDEILSFVGLSHRADHYPAQLSGGERQRVGLARSLVSRPPLLLCDEPTSSLDASTTGDVLRVLSDARDKLGTTVIVITHDLDVVKAICDRAALFEKGRLREIIPIQSTGTQSLPSYYDQVKRELM